MTILNKEILDRANTWLTSTFDEDTQELIKKGLNLFLDNQITQYAECYEVPIHFVGSIAFYLQEEIAEILAANNLQLGNILKAPIEGLVQYHIRNKLH